MVLWWSQSSVKAITLSEYVMEVYSSCHCKDYKSQFTVGTSRVRTDSLSVLSCAIISTFPISPPPEKEGRSATTLLSIFFLLFM